MLLNPLDGVVASLHFRNDSIEFVAVKRAAVPNLPARLRVKRRVIKNDLALFTRLEFLSSLPISDNGHHFTIFRPRLPIPLKLRLRQLLISRIRSLLGRTLPGCTCSLPLLCHCTIEALTIELNPLISCC